MFGKLFKQNKENKQIEVKKPTLIYQRIEKLYKNLSKAQEDEKILVLDVFNQDTIGWACCIFVSNYGERKVQIGFMKGAEFEYTFRYNIQDDCIFKINVSPYTTSVKPRLTPNSLTAHDIDMAIYEIEEYIRSKYGELEEIEDYHKQQVDILNKGE